MAKARIKGITVSIGGDVTGLDKALSGTNTKISKTQSNLRDVQRLLKLDPKNTELLAQKQRLLAEATEETKEKLQILQRAYLQMANETNGAVDIQQWEALQREIAETEAALRKLENAGKVSLDGISQKAGKISDTFRPVTQGVMALGAAAVATVPATQELREDLSRLQANAEENAVSAEAAEAAWKKFAVQTGETDSAVEAVSNLLQAGFSESNLQRAVENLAGAALRFPDTLKVESLADSLQETIATGAATGQFAELIERLGLDLEEFNGSLSRCGTEASRQNLALRTLASAGLADTYRAYHENNEAMMENKEANLELELAMAELAEVLMPFLTQLTQDLTGLLRWFNDLPEGAKGTLVAILGLLAAISPVAGAVANVTTVIGKLSGVSLPGLGSAMGVISGTVLPGLQTAFTTVFGFIAANPVVLLIGAIVGLVALVYAKGDEIQAILGKVNDFLKNIFAKDWEEVFGPVLGKVLNNFFGKLEEIWDAFYKLAHGVIDFIRGVFSGDWERAWQGVVDIFGGIFDGLTSLLKAPINGVIMMVNKAIDSINWLINGVNKIPGVDLQTIGTIPMLASGGEVLRGSAIVGDGGPELLTVLGDRTVVQPLTNNYRTNQLGGVNVNVYGAPGQDVRQLAQLVAEEIQTIVDSEEGGL